MEISEQKLIVIFKFQKKNNILYLEWLLQSSFFFHGLVDLIQRLENFFLVLELVVGGPREPVVHQSDPPRFVDLVHLSDPGRGELARLRTETEKESPVF